MPDDRLIAAPLPSTPPGSRSRPGAPQLTEDLLREASRRLGITSLLLAVLWVAGATLDHLALRALTHGDPRWLHLGMDDAVAGVSVLLSLALFFYTRKAGRDPKFVLDLGLVYMVVTAFALGLIMHWAKVPTEWHASPMISWIGPIVLMFAAIVPSTPARFLIAGFIAVSMSPLSMLVAKARGGLGLRPLEQRVGNALSRLSAPRRGGRHFARRNEPGP